MRSASPGSWSPGPLSWPEGAGKELKGEQPFSLSYIETLNIAPVRAVHRAAPPRPSCGPTQSPTPLLIRKIPLVLCPDWLLLRDHEIAEATAEAVWGGLTFWGQALDPAQGSHQNSSALGSGLHPRSGGLAPACSQPAPPHPTMYFPHCGPGAFFWDLTSTKPRIHAWPLTLPRAPSSSCSSNWPIHPPSCPNLNSADGLSLNTAPCPGRGGPSSTLKQDCVFPGHLRPSSC